MNRSNPGQFAEQIAPRRWKSTVKGIDWEGVVDDCPTQVGVCRGPNREFRTRDGLPPRMWGSTTPDDVLQVLKSDCPTQVGVYLRQMARTGASCRLPHQGGGLPPLHLIRSSRSAIAPRRWGSTRASILALMDARDCPADAGIYPSKTYRRWSCSGLPRRRGDPPCPECSTGPRLEIAPRRWGSTVLTPRGVGVSDDCPTHVVGVYHRPTPGARPSRLLPH